MGRTLILALSLAALVVLLAAASTAGALPLAASAAHAVPLADPGAAPAWSGAAAVPLAGLGSPSLPAGPAAPASLQWYDGAIQYSNVTNCASIIFGSPYTERNVGTYVGYAADPVAGSPRPNTVYYLHVYFAGLGNPCSGTRVYLDFQLPPNTALAIDGTNKLRCFLQPLSGGWSEFTNTADCSQSPSNAFNPYNPGAYQILSTDSAHGNTWPLPQGGAYEFQIPVRSSTVLSSSNFQANLWTLDGESSPWLRPQVGVYVFSGSGGGSPYFVFDSPSYITLTSTYVYNYGYLYFSGVSTSGNTYGELYDATGTTLLRTDGPANIPPSTYGYMVWVDWTPYVLTPNTAYRWRYKFVRSDNAVFYSAFQTFTTLPDKQVTIGGGTPAACTDAALGSALAGGAKSILFDCGPLPITITVSTSRFISGTVTIDGGNKVSLSGNNTTGHFSVNNYSTLTLTKITLINGYSNFACGSVVLQGLSHLVTSEARFINNHTTGWGGALCVQPSASANISYSQFAGNSAGSVGGGAIFNDQYAGTTITYSDISGNSATGNGGGIYNAGTLFFNFNALIGNLATTGANDGRGGGLYNTGSGETYAAASTVGGNGANYGGGISTDGSGLYLTGLTIAGNWADPGAGAGITRFTVGGGIESTNIAGAVYLVNTLLAVNWPGNCSAISFSRFYTSSGHNLDDAARCGFGGPGDLNNTNPRLGPLQINGGRTRTYGFVGNSPAIDAGDNPNCGFTDQRGYSGPGGFRQVDGNRDGAAVCDIGAFEFRPGLDLLARTFLPLIRR